MCNHINYVFFKSVYNDTTFSAAGNMNGFGRYKVNYQHLVSAYIYIYIHC